MVTRAPRLLVKAPSISAGMAFRVGTIPFTLKPLFPDRQPALGMGETASARWHLTDVPPDTDEAHLWDLCHHLNTHGFGVAGAPPVAYAEPDLEQKWVFDSSDRIAAQAFAAASGDDSEPRPPDNRFPSPSPFDWRWYLDGNHSQLDAARSMVQNPSDPVTIAHLDTGYRKDHKILPTGLDRKRQRSFVEGDPDPNDASDPLLAGFNKNPGHGTGTLSILAGSNFDGAPYGVPSGIVGGAPFARVIPVRVANSVVLFTNSSIAQGLRYAIDSRVDVVSMSMGGVPSQLWADVVNEAYEAGITMVTAAGNNFGPWKLRVPRFIVYPARFRRVVAACGVMSDGSPYADFKDPRWMAGSYGPDSKMDTAMAGYTPNAAWAQYDNECLIRFDGCGTSSATPQVAAAAACWLQKNRKLAYSQGWMRVEAVRQALFSQANAGDREHLGKGALRAGASMTVAPPSEAELQGRMQSRDVVDVPFLGPTLQVIFGAAQGVSDQMLRVETAQLLARNGELQNILATANIDPDHGGEVPNAVRQQFLEAVAADPSASDTLKKTLGASLVKERPQISVPSSYAAVTRAENPPIAAPRTRRLQVFAFDPVLGLHVETERINQTTLEIPWEPDLKPGPIGEYIEVVDVDPGSGVCYAPVNLNHPYLLANDGLDPAEGVPQFHQQMAYAVAMSTIGRFERALGRTALWAPRFETFKDKFQSTYVQRLRIYPHALREQNAYYSPAKKSLLFGYFRANQENAGDNLPGGLVFTCLSHDVVAHETTHALLDGLHRHYQEATNADITAFHEAFADIVALFQHFTIPVALRAVIARSQGDLKKTNLLADLAQQFGQASNGSRALRSALGQEPKVTDYSMATEAHARGAVLLAAVFQAFLEIYDARIAVLKRIATGGTGVLPPGDISADLVDRMAKEASAAADHVLRACIRALDYCPPVDLTFGEYLRALITADMDIEPEDQLNYRTAFISGFRARGIFPQGVRSMSEESLRWQPPSIQPSADQIRDMLKRLDLSWGLSTNRRQAFEQSESNGRELWKWLQELPPDQARAAEADLGVYITAGDHVPKEVPKDEKGVPKLQIHSVRPARRINSRGQQITDLVVEAMQRFVVEDDATRQEATYRGGFTLLVDMEQNRLRYAVRKHVGSKTRMEAAQSFQRMAADDSQSYFDPSRTKEPFAMLHRGE